MDGKIKFVHLSEHLKVNFESEIFDGFQKEVYDSVWWAAWHTHREVWGKNW